ncbi:ABC transporter permease [Thermovenabulum gondwanense]|uniref:Sulfate transport system permease protein CysW n=1 Tax=Thermovenabulum gondwanense TaxID=520767 RepID=A0A162MV30_9FIRM|nr:ABC transporter permease [Thermovenabulum gondwanense]KYO67787.1 Sulfate transport system permease protein CysW [Thermovenabulum gondwanense]
MNTILEGIKKGLMMLFSFNKEVYGIAFFSLKVSLTATLISVIVAFPIAMFLALKDFPGKKAVISFVNLGMSLPPTVVGLWVSLILWRSGPLGIFRLIYTPAALIIAQTVISTPIVLSLATAAFQQLDHKLKWQIMSLGATPLQLMYLMAKEARYSLMAAIIAGFGGAISEVGASMMVGGNIEGYTRVLTTAIVMETSKGNFETALALSIILMTLSYLATFWLTFIQQRRS